MLETKPLIILSNAVLAGGGALLLSKLIGNNIDARSFGLLGVVSGIALPIVHEKKAITISVAALLGLAMLYRGHRAILPWKTNVLATTLLLGTQWLVSTRGSSESHSSSTKNNSSSKSDRTKSKDNQDPLQSSIDLDELEAIDVNDEFGNTGFTKKLAEWAFPVGKSPEQKVSAYLDAVIKASASNKEQLKSIFRTPNEPHDITSGDGYPVNTPLMLLVKMGGEDALSAIEKMLPYYDQESLLKTTPRGNNPLHIAVFTGQFDVAMALVKRAEELGCLDALLSAQNNKRKTPDLIMRGLCQRQPFGKTEQGQLVDASTDVLGGEEIDKAAVNKSNPQIGDICKLFILEAKKAFPNFSVKMSHNYSLRDFLFATPFVIKPEEETQEKLSSFAQGDGLSRRVANEFDKSCGPLEMEGSYLPGTFARHSSANVQRLINLGTEDAKAYFPASQTTIEGRNCIVSEAPHSNEQRVAYYKMVVQTGSQVLVTASTGYKVNGSSVVPDDATMCFLKERESITFNHQGARYEVKCYSDETILLSDELAKKAGLTRVDGPPLNYHIRKLQVTKNQEFPNSVYQFVPDFVAVSSPLLLAIENVHLIKRQAKLAGLSLDNPIINWNTGKDRSAQLAIVFGVLEDLETYAGKNGDEAAGKLIQETNWAELFVHRALVMQSQTTDGGGIESINQTLLPKVTPALHAQRTGQQYVYDKTYNQDPSLAALTEKEKREANEGIQEALHGHLQWCKTQASNKA